MAESTTSGRSHCIKKSGTWWRVCPFQSGTKLATMVSKLGLL
jgi:hypothetical protein